MTTNKYHQTNITPETTPLTKSNTKALYFIKPDNGEYNFIKSHIKKVANKTGHSPHLSYPKEQAFRIVSV